MQNPCISNSNLERLKVMKKIYIAIAVLVAAVLASCQREQSFDNHVFGENEVAFTLTRGATRAATVGSPVTKGVTVDLGRVGNNNLFLEETITDLNAVSPGTRGIPVYTENVGYLEGFDLSVYVPDNGDATYDKLDSEIYEDETNGNGWRYSHKYASSIWPSDGGEVDFYFRMPANMTSNGVTLGTSAYSGGKTKFSYTSPTTAEGQQDIIFSHVKINKQQHKDALPGGYPVNFYHALTGIKFAVKNTVKNADGTESYDMGIKITGISFIGLKSTGDCEVNVHAAGTEADPIIKWSNLGGAANNTMTQTFTYADGDTNDKYVQNFAEPGEGETDNNHFAPSFYEGGVTQNINKDDASYTFWVIPQDLTGESVTAKIRIEYVMNDVPEYMEIPFNKIAKAAWDPAQLRTFTFKLNEVNVKIADEVTIPSTANAGNAYEGSYKDEVTITNTGNTYAFIRAAIVGQWLCTNKSAVNEAGDIVFGFTDAVGHLDLVESWYQDQFVNKERSHGLFVGLADYDEDNGYRGWTLCTDGYYYYTKAVAPEGSETDEDPCTTTPLFDSYTLTEAPAPTYGGQIWEVSDIYFTLEIATQAISANQLDGTHDDSKWADAWENATGVKPVAK